jgi:hypothetical protein
VSPQGEVILTSQLPDLPSPIPTRSKMGRLNIGEHSHLPLVATVRPGGKFSTCGENGITHALSLT